MKNHPLFLIHDKIFDADKDNNLIKILNFLSNKEKGHLQFFRIFVNNHSLSCNL